MGEVLIYHRENYPKRNLIKKSMGYAFALSLGLMVSIADIKMPAETDGRQVESQLKDLVPLNATSMGPELPLVGESKAYDLSGTIFIPYEEPELYPFEMVIHEAAGLYDVDPDLLLAVIMAESRFDPDAVSKKGAKGLMQLMPTIAEDLDVENVYSPEENVKAGAKHLKWLLDRLDGDMRLALAAYNAGLKNVLRYDGIPPYKETRSYVTKVMEYYAAIKKDSLDF
jgi:hypothetical protein